MRFANYFTHLDAVTEKSATPSFQIIYFKSICACEKIFVYFWNLLLQILLTPQKFTCIGINTEPLINQIETM